MSKAYLMSAYHLDGYKRTTVAKIAEQEPNCKIVVFQNRSRNWMTLTLGCSDYKIGDKVEYIKDTGLGYGYVPYDRKILEVVNVITVKDGVISSLQPGVDVSKLIAAATVFK